MKPKIKSYLIFEFEIELNLQPLVAVTFNSILTKCIDTSASIIMNTIGMQFGSCTTIWHIKN